MRLGLPPHVFTTWVLPGAMLAVAVALGWGFYAMAREAGQNYTMNEELAALEQEIAELKRENTRLIRAIQRAKSDYGIEQIAREEMNLIRPGDKTVLLVGPPQSAVAPQAPVAPPQPDRAPRPLWQQLLGRLSGT